MFPQKRVCFAFVGYTDFDGGASWFRKTIRYRRGHGQMAELLPKGWCSEQFVLGQSSLESINTSPRAKKVLVFMADAPPHSTQFNRWRLLVPEELDFLGEKRFDWVNLAAVCQWSVWRPSTLTTCLLQSQWRYNPPSTGVVLFSSILPRWPMAYQFVFAATHWIAFYSLALTQMYVSDGTAECEIPNDYRAGIEDAIPKRSDEKILQLRGILPSHIAAGFCWLR